VHKREKPLDGDVRDELAWDPMLDPSRMVVEANDGEVTLSGVVSTYC
jgi:osmotically-inducible protein OsmY